MELQNIKKQIAESIATKQAVINNEELCNMIVVAVDTIVKAYSVGNKVLVAGNGGSAADAQHIVGELVSKFYFDRPALPGVALTTNSSIMTAIGNDYCYEKIFSRQIEAMGREGDVFIGISTSGNSKNIVNALKVCKERNIFTIGMTGESGGEMNELCDLCLKVPSQETPRIQEVQMMIGHILCYLVEERIFGHLKH